MTLDAEDGSALRTLETRLQVLLPQEYRDAYEDIEPVPMGSAGLKYGADGKVAWDEIWQSFCTLAMAGGPPHKGRLLRPGTDADVAAQPDRYSGVVSEICRGVTMATGLPVEPSREAGWIHVGCDSEAMAGWLLRAITIENVAVRADGSVLDLPAGPDYRIDREIKNVVTAIAKTNHYWSGHMWRFEQRDVAELFAAMEADTPCITPAGAAGPASAVDCPTARAAVWMMRMMVASNVVARREETTLFLPIDDERDPGGAMVAARLALVQRLAAVKGLV
jgi:hypothetical protein